MQQVNSITDTMNYKISTRLLMQEALRKGYSVTYFPSSPSTQSGITWCKKGNKELFFKSTCTALTPSYGVHSAENKYLTYSLLTGHKINVPVTAVLRPDDESDSLADMLNTYQKLVVKPVKMNHGDGVTMGVSTMEDLSKAVAFARNAGGMASDVIVQQQVAGKEYRFLVVLGKVVAVAGRRPAFVVGDGISTVEVLLQEKNKDPRRGIGHTAELTVIDIEKVKHHKGEDFVKYVPTMGEEVNLLDTSNLSKGGESTDFTDIVSPELKKMAIAAAESCFLGVAGVDIITPDITTGPLSASYVIEVNLTPGLRMHQFPTVGKSRNVAATVFGAIEKTARTAGKRQLYVGRAEKVAFPELSLDTVAARVDTGARTSAIWASHVMERSGILEVVFFGPESEFYTGKTVTFKEFGKTVVATSTGHIDSRYKVRLLIKVKGKKIRAWFTLADRSMQVYPVLIGRNVLLGKFIVDVGRGDALIEAEKERSQTLRSYLDRAKE